MHNPQQRSGVNMRKMTMAKVTGGLLAAALLGLVPQAATADSRILGVAPYGPPAVIYDRAEGLFYRMPPYYWSRYYGLDPYDWHYRNSGRYGQPYNQVWQGRFRPRTYYYVPPSAAIYHVLPAAPTETRRPGEAPTGSVPQTPPQSVPAPAPNKSPQQKDPDVDL
jgi:hypothetical protein